MSDARDGRELKPVAGGSTAAVLWLMITLVFVPIIVMHAAARFVGAGQAETAGTP